MGRGEQVEVSEGAIFAEGAVGLATQHGVPPCPSQGHLQADFVALDAGSAI